MRLEERSQLVLAVSAVRGAVCGVTAYKKGAALGHWGCRRRGRSAQRRAEAVPPPGTPGRMSESRRRGRGRGKKPREGRKREREREPDPGEKATRPKLKKMKSQTGQVGEKQSLKCEAAAGNPQPSYRWFKDGKELNRSRDIRIKYGNGRKNSRLQFNKVKVEDAGEYVCEAENILGKDSVRGRLHVNSVSTTLSSWSGHARKCNETAKSYCVNGGVCYYIEGINQLSCKCPVGYTGDRCQQFAMVNFSKHLGFELKEAEELYQKRVLTITGICVALLVVGIVCVVAYCKTKKQRKQMHNHLRQNMCPAHQNRSLANGPSHPRLDPEEIQMADYISKNVPATDHVIRRETETTFSGSHSCSPSHHCSTATPTSSHRHESHTWSLERSESLTSDSQSGIMLSSVGTSKCNSPACVEARARRAAAYSLEERRRATVPPYHDSVDSLRDSPHSERYVSALTTPARLSPVDFHYSLATQVPTFEITFFRLDAWSRWDREEPLNSNIYEVFPWLLGHLAKGLMQIALFQTQSQNSGPVPTLELQVGLRQQFPDPDLYKRPPLELRDLAAPT
ncbi:pro-neuregulin-2, membrane-bound isoform [Tupaia chinensis]|uniref:pro-neuregulin-2, membrane-bound isoform n=1 Tax=Tupaia chinensis TaxID=246437 RepID=UPI000FFB614E|nr:pro-neuregulin-2, membrane-bound isoform [Tupaia chinensis]